MYAIRSYYVSFTAGPPCCLVISISGSKRIKQTVQNIKRTGLLSATVVTRDMLPFVEQNNKATAQEGRLLPQEFEAGKTLHVPLLKGATWSYECEVIKTIQIGSCDTFFAAYQQVNVREDVQKLDFIDLTKVLPTIYADGHYFTVGEHIGEIGDYS